MGKHIVPATRYGKTASQTQQLTIALNVELRKRAEAMKNIEEAVHLLNASRWPHTPTCTNSNTGRASDQLICICRTAGHNEVIDRVLDYLEGIK